MLFSVVMASWQVYEVRVGPRELGLFFILITTLPAQQGSPRLLTCTVLHPCSVVLVPHLAHRCSQWSREVTSYQERIETSSSLLSFYFDETCETWLRYNFLESSAPSSNHCWKISSLFFFQRCNFALILFVDYILSW